MFRRVLLAVAAVVLAACGGGGGVSSNGPSGLSHCPQSGDVTKISDKDTQGEWQYQQKQGATGGNIDVYAASSSDCMGMPDIRKGSAKILASAEITYKDSGTATAAFNGGVFGVSNSNAAGMSGAVKGSSSGFGGSSVYAYSSTESIAIWASGSKVGAVIGENVSESDFKNFANGAKSQTG